jgi:hypothetical protein
MAFTSLEEIDKHYKAQIDATEDAVAKADLRVQQADDRAAFREAQALARERESWKREALSEFPGAKEIPELVSGSTEDEIKASAKAAHERVQKLSGKPADGRQTQTDLQQQAKSAYGTAGGVGGGTAVQYTPEEEKWLDGFVERFNRQDPSLTRADIDRFTRIRGQEHIRREVGKWAMATRGGGSVPVP